jgi:hypothetical protein
LDAAKVAAYGLVGAADPPVGLELDAGDWNHILGEATTGRFTGLLAAMALDEALSLSDAQADALADTHLSSLGRDLLAERTLLWGIQCLDDAGVDHRVLKGAAVAHLDYPDPALRSFADADILVGSDCWERALRSLVDAGARRTTNEPRSGWDRRFAKGATLISPDGFEIDVHRTFVSGPFGFTVKTEDLWSSPETFELGGRQLRTISREARWLHACFGAAVSDVPPKLIALRDTLQLASDSHFDAERALRIAQAWEATSLVRRAVELAGSRLGVAVNSELSELIAHAAASRKQTRMLRCYTNPGDRYVAMTLRTTLEVPGFSAKVAYITGLIWPQADYVGSVYQGRVERFKAIARRTGRALKAGWDRRKRRGGDGRRSIQETVKA